MFDIQIVRGRTFTPAEAVAGAAVALSEATAAALWPGLDPRPDARSDSGSEGRAPTTAAWSRGVVHATEDVATGSILDGIDATCVYFRPVCRPPGTRPFSSGPASTTSKCSGRLSRPL